MSGETRRCGFVAVIGAPNSGKSTLVNRLVRSKISIVTPKVQTTRMRIRGVSILEDVQTIFVDTPGIFRPRRLLDRAMVRAAWTGAGEADAVLFLVDAPAAAYQRGNALADALSIIDALRRFRPGNAALALNKIDALPRALLLPLTDRLNFPGVFERVFMVSALNGNGLGEVRDWCTAKMPKGPWLYPPDQIADMPSTLRAAEITREKLYFRLHQELPYAAAVEPESWTELKDGSLRIEQTIYVERESQKPIVLGQGGRTLKSIGAAARRDLENALDRRVHLFLFVKVRERWSEDRAHLQTIGLDVPEE